MVTSQREPGNQRRGSQRIYAATSVEVGWHTDEGKYVTEHADTENVSAHGGLLRMKHGFPIRQVVDLSPTHATNWTRARVMRCDPPRREGWTSVAVELAVPSEGFWGILFWSGV